MTEDRMALIEAIQKADDGKGDSLIDRHDGPRHRKITSVKVVEIRV